MKPYLIFFASLLVMSAEIEAQGAESHSNSPSYTGAPPTATTDPWDLSGERIPAPYGDGTSSSTSKGEGIINRDDRLNIPKRSVTAEPAGVSNIEPTPSLYQ